MDVNDGFSPFEQYKGKGPASRQRFVKWFHNNRLRDFANLIEPGERVLSVGSGNAEFESNILNNMFEEVYTIEINKDHAITAHKKGINSIYGSGTSLPFDSGNFDAIVAAGTMEHLPDERQFIKESYNCLRAGGNLYVTLPIEIGLGGFIRFLGKNFVHLKRSGSPDGMFRYFDYSFSELSKNVPRKKHGTTHRYYNYIYALQDMREEFSEVETKGWPIEPLHTLNFITYAKATK